MSAKDLLRHRKEFSSALDNNDFEVTDTGAILVPKAHVLLHGEYVHYAPNDGLGEIADPNLVVNEGLLSLLGVYLKGDTQITAWYLSLFTNNYTPLAALTAATYVSTAGENTSTTEGYTETPRQTWTGGTPASNAVDNTASKAAFTFASATNVVIYGAGLHSVATRGATTGKLLSASKFTAARTLYDTDVFNLSWRLSLTSS